MVAAANQRAVPFMRFQTGRIVMHPLPKPANTDTPASLWGHDHRLLTWLTRMARGQMGSTTPTTVEAQGRLPFPPQDHDWQSVADICGYGLREYLAAGTDLPLRATEIEHFRRNHRGTENHVNRDFLTARNDLPSPLSELYGLYLHRIRLDAEAALFVAQATGSTRIAETMADLLAIGAFANAMDYVSHVSMTYSIAAAFDTSDILDRANHEAKRRLALPSGHPAHLLAMTPDDIAALAVNIANNNALTAADFLDKANLLAEARQDVNRLPVHQHFLTAYGEGDIPNEEAWGARLHQAYTRLFGRWLTADVSPKLMVQ